ncbi:hypothetical protein HDU86_005330 [Geranomyces michiganensis]|nr:hypothetical protein HDU86_005330 [Geranomyces michiganensis]
MCRRSPMSQQQQQQQQQPQQQQPAAEKPAQLSELEEDDEFEDFAVESESSPHHTNFSKRAGCALTRNHISDWTEADEDHEDATLWDDNWDDEDVNDDFTRHLRFASLTTIHLYSDMVLTSRFRAELMKPIQQQ